MAVELDYQTQLLTKIGEEGRFKLFEQLVPYEEKELTLQYDSSTKRIAIIKEKIEEIIPIKCMIYIRVNVLDIIKSIKTFMDN